MFTQFVIPPQKPTATRLLLLPWWQQGLYFFFSFLVSWNELDVNSVTSVCTRVSQKAKIFFVFPKFKLQAASTTHSINSRLGPGILHTRRGLLAVPPIFSTYSRLPFHLPLHNLTWSLPKPNKTAALTFWLQEILAWATHSPSISIPPSSPNCHSSQKCCKLWPNRRKKNKKKTPNDTYQQYTITSATKLVT